MTVTQRESVESIKADLDVHNVHIDPHPGGWLRVTAEGSEVGIRWVRRYIVQADGTVEEFAGIPA